MLSLLQKIILGAGAALVAALALYVPWVYSFEGPSLADSPTTIRFEYPAGYSLVFNRPAAGPQPEMKSLPARFWVARVNLPRVLLPIGAVVGVTAVALLLTRKPRSP